MTKVLYYYSLSTGAPSHVSRCIAFFLSEKHPDIKISLVPQKSTQGYIFPKKVNVIKSKILKEVLDHDIIHLSMSPSLFPNKKFLLFLLALISKSKLVVNYHGHPREEFKIKIRNGNLKALLYLPDYLFSPYIMKKIDLIIVNSQNMKSILEDDFQLENIKVIPNGIDASWFHVPAEVSFLENGDLNLFYHGRLAPEKGVDLLLYAFSIICLQSNKKIHLYIAGDGEQRSFLEKLCVHLSIEDKVHFLGKISDSSLKSYLNSVDAAIYPSIYEPFSIAVLEAFCLVKGPVIYSSRSGINNFVSDDGYQFWIVEPSVKSLSEALLLLINKNYDLGLETKQKQFANKYEWSQIVDEYSNLYNELVSS